MKKCIQALAIVMLFLGVSVMAAEGPQPRTVERLFDYGASWRRPGFSMTYLTQGTRDNSRFVRFDYAGTENNKAAVLALILTYDEAGNIKEEVKGPEFTEDNLVIERIAAKLDIKKSHPKEPSNCIIH